MKQRGLAAAAVAVGACVWLTGCGLPGSGSAGEKEEGKTGGEEEATPEGGGDASWEEEFPDGVSPVIEMDVPGGRGQAEALDEYFAFYGQLFQAIHDKDGEQEFLSGRLTDEAPSRESLQAGMNAFIDANAVPAGDMRFYNGQVAAWSQEAVQVDFCVDQRAFTVEDADSGGKAEVPDDVWQAEAFEPNILEAGGAFQQDGSGEWKSTSFSISAVEGDSSDVYDCLAEADSEESQE